MQKPTQTYGIYHRSVLERKVRLHISEVGKNIKQNLERKVAASVENRCIPEGFVRNHSVSIITYSAGISSGENIVFYVVYNCLICRPVENMIVDCVAKSITESAGIRAEVMGEDGSIPLTIFVSRDHNYTNKNFSLVKEGDKIQARIIGVNYEINDPMIYAIAYFVDPNAGERNYKKG